MATLSVVILTFNEEDNISECLKSVSWADEIIVVDSESTDRTVEIARQHTDKVYVQSWLGFSEQRNFGLTKASGEWVFFLDADERVTPELRDSIKDMLDHPQSFAAYSVVNENFFMNKFLKSCRETHLRLFKTESVRYVGDVHEMPIFTGRVGHLNGIIKHYVCRDIRSYVQKQVRYANLSAIERYRKGKRCGAIDVICRPVVDFCKHYIIKTGFLDGFPGFVYSCIHAFYTFLKYTMLYELNFSRCVSKAFQRCNY